MAEVLGGLGPKTLKKTPWPQNRQIWRRYWGGSAPKLEKRHPGPEKSYICGVGGRRRSRPRPPQPLNSSPGPCRVRRPPLPRRFGCPDTVPSLAPAHERPPPNSVLWRGRHGPPSRRGCPRYRSIVRVRGPPLVRPPRSAASGLLLRPPPLYDLPVAPQ